MEYKYKAFISYNHNPRDTKVAETLHRMIETYSIPRKLRDRGVKKLGKVFRDEEELSASNNLSGHIRDALDGSEFLIVICSPGALASKWVSQEIAHFLENHAPEKILTVLTGGNGAEIYGKLLPGMPEPLFLDLATSTDAALHRELKERFLKLCAPLLGRDYDELVMRDQKRRRQRLLSSSAAVLTVAAVIIGILLWSNWQIEGKNRELEQKNDEILLRESELLIQDALEALAKNDQISAVRNALEALSGAEGERPYYAQAEQVLFSELDLFHIEEGTMVPQDTVLEQTSPIEDFCINADGSLLITVDPYSVVTCFDTVTGEQVWTRQIEESYAYSSIQLCVCDAWDSVILQYNDTFFSLSQQTGEVLWTNAYAFYNERFVLSDDGQYLACMVDRGFEGRLSLAVISAETGVTRNVYPVIENADSLYLSDSDAYDFSSDGTLFAGCFSTQQEDQSHQLIYFVTDLKTGKTEIVYTQSVDMISSYNCIRMLRFADQDTTLTVIRDPYSGNALGIVEKLSIPEQKLLWRCDMPEENILEVIFLNHDPIFYLTLDPYLLIGDQSCLYALDPGSGALLHTLTFDSPLVHLEHVQDHFFAYILRDGTYSMGSANSYGLHDLSSWGSFPVLALQRLEAGKLWNRGLIRFFSQDGFSGFCIDTQENGFGYTASIPEDNDHCVIIRRASLFMPELDKQTIFTADENESLELYSPVPCGEHLLAAELTSDVSENVERHHFKLFDRRTLEPVGNFDFDASPYGCVIMLLPDGTGLLYQTDIYELLFYDAHTRQSTMVTPIYGSIKLDSGADAVNAKILEYRSGTLSCDQSILTALATTHGIRLLRNETVLGFVPYPDNLIFPEATYLLKENLHIGANGYVLLDLLRNDREPVCDGYLLYDTESDKWHRIPFGENDAAYHVVCLGESSPLLTIMDSGGLLRTYDISSGAQTMEIATGLTPNAVKQLRWILDDRYLTIYTKDGELLILDGITGKTVFRLKTEFYFYDAPSFAADRQGERLYIWKNGGFCVDTGSWTVLTEIPDMVLYDPDSDRIFQKTVIWEDDVALDVINVLRLPTTKELVEIGMQFLGQ